MKFLKRFYSFVAFALLFGIFNFICFTSTADYTTSFYVSLGFGNFSLLLCLITTLFSFAKRQVYLVYSYYVVTTIYEIIAVFLNLIFIWTGLDNVKTNIVWNTIIAAIFLIVIFISLSADADTKQQAKEHTKNLNYHYDMCDAVRSLRERSTSLKINKKLEAFYDAVANSQINVDNEALYQRDQKIIDAARRIDGLLNEAESEENLISEINKAIALVDERNEYVKQQLMRGV